MLSALSCGWYGPQGTDPQLSDVLLVDTALPWATDESAEYAATEMHRSRVVEPDAGGPRRGARRAARALPTTSAGEAIKATRRPLIQTTSRRRSGPVYDSASTFADLPTRRRSTTAYDFQGFQGSYASLRATLGIVRHVLPGPVEHHKTCDESSPGAKNL